TLSAQHDALDKQLQVAKSKAGSNANGGALSPAARLAWNDNNARAVVQSTNDRAVLQKKLAGYDKRVDDQKELAGVYGQWVGFIGWFVLMGRNGIRLGDWVEINGVTGEVIELGMFHTVLLETGNWTDSGHPTGRRVTFTNGFAIEGHYFNFSTSGQWLWDEI